MKNLKIKLLITALAVTLGTTANAATDSKVNLLLAGKDNDKHDKRKGNDKNDRSDTAITTNVKAKFVQEKLFGDADISAMSISVETTNGIVHLTGTADNKKQIKNAVKLAKSVDGVKGVVNKVKVKKDDNDDDNDNDNGDDDDDDDKDNGKNKDKDSDDDSDKKNNYKR
jgi:hypothetical protein